LRRHDDRKDVNVKISRFVLLLAVFNAVFWVVAFHLPFASHFSDGTLHRLSNVAVGVCLFFPLAFVIVAVTICWRNQRSLAVRKWDVIIPLLAVAIDAFLISKV